MEQKSVFTKVLELALCCCSEIPVPAAAKAHDAPTRRPNEASELAAAPAVAPQPAELDAETVAKLAAVRERRQKEARARREAERAAQTTLQLAARREAALLSPSENPVLSQTRREIEERQRLDAEAKARAEAIVAAAATLARGEAAQPRRSSYTRLMAEPNRKFSGKPGPVLAAPRRRRE